MNHISPRRGIILLLITVMITAKLPAFAQENSKTVKVAMSAAPSPQTVQGVFGPQHYGKDFGLNITKDDYVVFDSGAVAAQAVISGQSNVLFAAFVQAILLNQAGQNFKLFCPTNAKIDQVLVGRNGVTTLDQVLDPKTRVGIDGPGGGSTILLNALLIAHDLKITTLDLKNVKQLDSPTLRQSGWASDQVDVTIMRLSQFRQSQPDVPDGVVIAKPYEELSGFIYAGLMAPAEWLDANRDTAAAFCASVLTATVDLSASNDAYIAAVKSIIEKPPSDSALTESHDLIIQYGFWTPSASMNVDAIAFMLKTAKASGILTQEIAPESLLDMATYEAALKLLPENYQNALSELAATATPQS
jgi:ABC-type nitrate/sulfonate/bicarbonate transport system substrate-binding protein